MQWAPNQKDIKKLDIGFFGASTGAAAALYAAASFKELKALVCRGGRTDLVDDKTLQEVSCPSLFIAGSNDKRVIGINKKTFNQLVKVKEKKLEIVKGASHLFEEEGKIEIVAESASEWFTNHFT